jgi:hypothetical protein
VLTGKIAFTTGMTDNLKIQTKIGIIFGLPEWIL